MTTRQSLRSSASESAAVLDPVEDQDEVAASEVPTLRRGLIVVGLAIALVVVCAASLALGSQRLSLPQVWDGLTTGLGEAGTIVRDLRIPRTIVGIAVAASLGIAGALIQGFTRNPLADPGILGVNQGASAGVVLGVGFLGVTSAAGYIWFAFLGAVCATVLVYLIGSAPAEPRPTRFA